MIWTIQQAPFPPREWRLLVVRGNMTASFPVVKLLPDHDRLAKADMLIPNAWFAIGLIAHGHHIAVERDGAPLFEMDDAAPYRRGHFGLRTTQSHIQVRNLTITHG